MLLVAVGVVIAERCSLNVSLSVWVVWASPLSHCECGQGGAASALLVVLSHDQVYRGCHRSNRARAASAEMICEPSKPNHVRFD